MTDKNDLLESLREAAVIGILRADDASWSIEAMDALFEGGLKAFEVTTTTPNFAQIITKAAKRFGGKASVGIGTVLDAATAGKGIDAGAQFVVSPSLHKDVIDVCKERGVVSCPGTFTATEVVEAWKWGADLIKVFPASQVGPEYIKALLGPFPWVKLVPTGGIDTGNAADFLKAGAYCLGVGGFLFPKKAVSGGRYEELTERARAILEKAREGRM
jgi:2-dehydro-3-deoxyphosphogluconate aldolase / (4S)-4-hydroxy-2-oxoglutarate aldolase